MKNSLVIIDMQNDYFPGGRMELSGIDKAAENVRKLLDHYRAENRQIIHVQHFSLSREASFFAPDTPGVEINKLLKPAASETIIKKNYPNSFRDTGLLDKLRSGNTGSLTICGAMSHMCVDATTRAAFDLGFKCTVVTDACASRDLEFNGKIIPAEHVHGAFMAALYPVYARLAITDEIISDGKGGK